MLQLRFSALLVLGLLTNGIACAETGYKCIDAQGHIAFQDRPCPPDQHTASFHYDPAPRTTLEPAAAPAVESPPIAPVVATPIAERAPVPPLYTCTRGDGGEPYYSNNGATTAYTVPLGILGYPSHSIHEVYGGRDGVGISAPEFSRPRVLPADASQAVAGASVWVQDDCRALPTAEACRVRAKQLDELRSKLRRAFKDERATLEPHARELAQQLAGC